MLEQNTSFLKLPVAWWLSRYQVYSTVLKCFHRRDQNCSSSTQHELSSAAESPTNQPSAYLRPYILPSLVARTPSALPTKSLLICKVPSWKHTFMSNKMLCQEHKLQHQPDSDFNLGYANYGLMSLKLGLSFTEWSHIHFRWHPDNSTTVRIT